MPTLALDYSTLSFDERRHPLRCDIVFVCAVINGLRWLCPLCILIKFVNDRNKWSFKPFFYGFQSDTQTTAYHLAALFYSLFHRYLACANVLFRSILFQFYIWQLAHYWSWMQLYYLFVNKPNWFASLFLLFRNNLRVHNKWQLKWKLMFVPPNGSQLFCSSIRCFSAVFFINQQVNLKHSIIFPI